MFKKILVANRGEIAVRVINACREMNIPTLAVYSDADRTALHVQLADEAVHIGPASPLESYLNIEKIINTAKENGVDAIHPGYGFLSEKASFAKACDNAGIIFIGPKAEAISLVGSKVECRQTMIEAGIPLVPGMMKEGATTEELRAEAEKIGYPLLVKASAGGGGKGMRVVNSEADLSDAVDAARREAMNAFSDDTVYIEKCIVNPRHIEFQILGDNFGNVIHLFERECSIQRRHQKIVEETPSTALSPELRKEMGDMAVRVAKAVGYTNAGTVECLLDQDGRYYFLEVNARIQVEHPVTEMVTGIDLVKWQIKIAAGQKLTLRQEDMKQRGHSIECRIYAEDPANNFFPSPGKVLFMKEPAGPGIRNDCGIYSRFNVTPDYDPILSKLVVWAEDRDGAIDRMIHALNEYVILGIKTPITFLKQVMSHPAFRDGSTYTDFITKNMPGWEDLPDEEYLDTALAAAALYAYLSKGAGEKRGSVKAELSPWQTVGKWSN